MEVAAMLMNETGQAHRDELTAMATASGCRWMIKHEWSRLRGPLLDDRRLGIHKTQDNRLKRLIRNMISNNPMPDSVSTTIQAGS